VRFLSRRELLLLLLSGECPSEETMLAMLTFFLRPISGVKDLRDELDPPPDVGEEAAADAEEEEEDGEDAEDEEDEAEEEEE
jgi:hypothetical protein